MTYALAGYEAARSADGLALWSRSPRGLLELRGADRAAFLQGMVSNDVAALRPGESCPAALLDSTAHLLASLHVHAFPETLVVETDPECFAVVFETLDRFLIIEDVTLRDVSGEWAIVSVLGGGAEGLKDLRKDLPGEIRPLSVPLAPGFDLWLPAGTPLPVWQGAETLSAEAAETLRVEAGLPRWGQELSPAVLLPETGMAGAVSYTKGCYVGQEIVARLHARGHANRILRSLLLAEDAPVPPVGAQLHVPEDGPEPGREIGRVTSAVASPQRGGRALALGYVRKEYWEPGTPVSVQIEQPGGLMFSYHAEVL